MCKTLLSHIEMQTKSYMLQLHLSNLQNAQSFHPDNLKQRIQ